MHEVDALGGEIGKMADRWWVGRLLQQRWYNAAAVPWLAECSSGCGSVPGVSGRCHLLASSLHPSRRHPQSSSHPTRPPPAPIHLFPRSYLQKRVLNASKGPAVWALRAQTDKLEYAATMRRVLEETPNLYIREGERLHNPTHVHLAVVHPTHVLWSMDEYASGCAGSLVPPALLSECCLWR